MPLENWSDAITIAHLNDEPSFSDDMDAMHRRLESSDCPAHVIADMTSVTYLNSTNIAQLLRLRKRLHDAGSRMRLCCVADPVWSVLLITGLDKVFDCTDDVSTSIAALQIAQ